MERDEAFWSRVDQTGDCWIWQGYKRANGYGEVRRNMIRYYVHRYALMQAGVNVDGFHVDHICHNKSCVRPHHLRTVTPKQNMENRSGANSNNPTGIRGVSRYKDGRWRGFVGHLGQCTYRTFRTREDAVEWVTAKRLELFTHNDADRTEAVCR